MSFRDCQDYDLLCMELENYGLNLSRSEVDQLYQNYKIYDRYFEDDEYHWDSNLEDIL